MDSPSDFLPAHSTDVLWYYLEDGVPIGPLSEQDLLDAARQNSIRHDTLVWQPAYDTWKEAATIPIVAANLAEPFMTPAAPEAVEPERRVVAAPTQPAVVPEPEDEQTSEDLLGPSDLGDAISDEEAVEPGIDVQQVRQILERASCFPPERSIPPASIGSSQIPPRMPAKPSMGVSQALGLAGTALVIGVFALSISTSSSSGKGASSPSEVETRSTSQLARSKSDAVAQAAPTRPSSDETAPIASTHSQPSGPVPRTEEPLPTAIQRVPAPLPELGSPVRVLSGPLSEQLFRSKLERSSPMFDKQCWDRMRAPVGDVTPHPFVEIGLSVDPWGHIYEIESTKAPSGYRGAGLCIIGRMRGWRFPKTGQTTRVELTVAHGQE